MSSNDSFSVTIDKFVFKVNNEYFYDKSHIWYNINENRVIIGITDYLQQTIGDIAFISCQKIGDQFHSKQKVIEIETMKVNIDLSLPVEGEIVEVNESLESNPELINEDPYVRGWILKFELVDYSKLKSILMNSEKYGLFMKKEAEHKLEE